MYTPDFGLRFLVEPSGNSLTPDERKMLSELRPVGILLRKRNFREDLPYKEWIAALSDLLKDVVSASGRKNLIISIDHEGGRVVRPPLPITRFPYASRWREASKEVGHAHGRELLSLGINLSFAPVVDIHSNPKNPVINQRAFGRTAEEVIQYAIPYLNALREEGILTCAKHFPGHGDTEVDSHWTLPVLNRSKDELMSRELIPFKSAIGAGVPMIMTAHIVATAIDSVAATFSETFLKDILCRELGYQGLIIADALGMHAVRGDLDKQSVIAKGLAAGLDIFAVVGDNVSIETAVAINEECKKLFRDNIISEEIFKKSEEKIIPFLAQCEVTEPYLLSEEVLSSHAALVKSLEGKSEWDLTVPGFE